LYRNIFEDLFPRSFMDKLLHWHWAVCILRIS